MGRPPHITTADLLLAATQLCARHGPGRVTVAAIAREAKVPIGSVYHRVPSRAALLAEVWISAADRFGSEFLASLRSASTLDAAVEAALVTPKFAREHHAAGVVLFMHRRDDFLAEAPDGLRGRATELSTALQKGLADAARRLLPRDPRARERLSVALIGVPYGAVRVFLPQAVPPAELDPVIAAAARAALQSQR